MTVSRRGGREKRVAGAIRQLPFARLANPYSPIEILSADQVDAIIDGALTVLETRGMRFLEAGSRATLKAAGAEPIDEAGTMRLDRSLVREKLALAPAEFTLRARNRERDIRIGGKNLVFTSVGGPAFCNDLDKGRRPAHRPRSATSCAWCRASTSCTRNPAAPSRPWTCRPSRGTSTCTSRR